MKRRLLLCIMSLSLIVFFSGPVSGPNSSCKTKAHWILGVYNGDGDGNYRLRVKVYPKKRKIKLEGYCCKGRSWTDEKQRINKMFKMKKGLKLRYNSGDEQYSYDDAATHRYGH
ncbi:MAG: hypothetical protein IKQ97_05455, partial [Eubacterium sp.]|nr:hypothetical protein [Eubacterium sp.]